MRQEHDRQSYLCSVGSHVAPDTPEVAGPGDAAWMDQETGGDVQVDRKSNRYDDKQAPQQR